MIFSDKWAQEFRLIETQCIQAAEILRRRDQHQKGSRAFLTANKELEPFLSSVKEQLQSLTSLLNQQSITGEITEAEAERRQSLLRNAESRYLDLEAQSKTNVREISLRKDLFGDERTISWAQSPPDTAVGTVEERIQAQEQYVQEQDAGLDQLAVIMSRTKTTAEAFSAELDLHNEVLDEVGEQMESLDTRLIQNTRRTRELVRTSDTCHLWLIIVGLMIAIVVLAASGV